jgi:hypothetical protein
MNEFIGQGPQVVIVARDDNSFVTDYINRGIHLDSSFAVYNEYSESADAEFVVNDQIDKLQKWKTLEPKQNIFLLSWTETMTGINAVDGLGNGNRANAAEINARLFGSLAPVMVKDFPNIIVEDYIVSPDLVCLSMALNHGLV